MRRLGLSLCFCALLAACGSSTSASGNRLALPPTQVAASAAPSASIAAPPLPTATVPAAAPSAASAPASACSGARWHGIPTPGTLTPHQEGANRYAAFVAGTQKSALALCGDAYRADGWVEETRTASNGSEFFTYRKARQRFVVAFGPDLGTNQVVVVIEDGL